MFCSFKYMCKYTIIKYKGFYSFICVCQLCVKYLNDTLSINNVCDAMQAAVTYGQDNLKKNALNYIEQNTQVCGWPTVYV